MNAGTTAARNSEFPSPRSFKRDIALKCASSLPACRRTASHCALPLKAVPSPAVFSLKESGEASVEMLFPQEQTEDAAQTAGPDATAGGGAGRARVSSNPRPAESMPTCYNCDQPGHKVRDCPLPKNEKKVRMKVPTAHTTGGALSEWPLRGFEGDGIAQRGKAPARATGRDIGVCTL